MATNPQNEAAFEQSSNLIARSLFGFIFVGTLASAATLPFLLSAEMRAQSRAYLLGGYAVYGLFLLLLCGIVLRRKPDQWLPFSQNLVRVISRPKLSIILGFLIVEGSLLIIFFIEGITPNLSVLIFLDICWAVIALTALIIANYYRLRAWMTKTQPIWISTGISLTLLVGLGILYYLNGRVLTLTHLVDYLRGSADYRQVQFFGEAVDPAKSQKYWQELGNLSAQWLPYTYSRIEPHSGVYINVSPAGLRRTASFIPDGQAAPSIFFFGGSTVWGDGVRDDYTIPSDEARLFHDMGQPIRVTNYAQIAYVSTQDLILFENQLALGNVPDVAVFYQGFNDIAGTFIDGKAGMPHNEINRVEEFYMGRLLDSGNVILKRPGLSLSNFDYSLVASKGDSVQETVDRYLANVRLIRAIAAEYKVRVLFVWQPAIVFKQSLTALEQQSMTENLKIWPDFIDVYKNADAYFRSRVAAEHLTDIINISDLFKDEAGYVFIDRVHLTEDADNTVAKTLQPFLAKLLDTRP